MKINKLNWKILAAAVIAVVILFFSSIIRFLVDLQWYKELGYVGVFFTRLVTQFKVGIPIFLVLTAIAYSYFLYLKREYIKGSNTIYTADQLKVINKKLFITAAAVSAVGSIWISLTYWYDILKFLNSTPFNMSDPLFNKDISFYIFRLPVYKALYSIVFGVLIILTLVTIIFYILTAINGNFSYSDYGNIIRINRGTGRDLGKRLIELAGSQLAFFISVIFLMVGAGVILKNYNLVYSPRGAAFGASYTDINVTMLFNRVFIGLSVLGAVSIFYALKKKKVKMTIWVIGIMLGISVIQGVVEAGVEKLIVSPNALEKEQKYIGYNIKYTKQAYGLSDVEERDFPAEQNLTQKDIESNRTTIENIRVNDFEPALEVYNQLQGIRSYYRFNDMDIDRYNINGDYTQIFIAARELDQEKVDPQSQTWINRHIIYTHGYGITMSPVNTVTSQGQPSLIIKDIPPASSVGIKVDRPEIYFGELTNDYVITNTRTPEMDYPSGDTNKVSFYEGKAGIKLGVLNRLLFMIDRGSFNFILSGDITKDSRILMHRNVTERARKIAPFLFYDKDPYIVINNGKLYWILDAYTTSSAYPYSEPYNGINYIRNSVKVIVDAYDGTTNFYLIDESDPIAMTYSSIFPGLFKKYNEIPEGFVEHFRYPEDIFRVQADVYKKYHMTDPRVFYNTEDLWSIAQEAQTSEQNDTSAEPSYIVMKLPNGLKEEFILTIPYTPVGKVNMVAWMGARMDEENYGKLILYKFPKQKVTYGPYQFKSRAEADPVISKDFSLWGQQGSSIIKGNVLTIPIEKSMLYVMPVYIKSSGTNSIPEMKRVVLGYGDRIVMDETLDKALITMFDLKQAEKPPAQAVPPQAESVAGVRELIIEANNAFEKAKEAQQRGDWAEYGNRLKELEEALKQLGSSIK